MADATIPPAFVAIYRLVRQIPRGKIMTYGQVAEWAGFPRGARLAATALKQSGYRAATLPWHRVVGKRGAHGRIAILDPVGAAIATQLLQQEGVEFSAPGLISLARFGHLPRLQVAHPDRERKPRRARKPVLPRRR